MAKTHKNIPSLHQLLESAPVESVRDFLFRIDDAQYAANFTAITWADSHAVDDAVETSRHAAIRIAGELKPDAAIPLEQHAQRILTLSDGKGIEAIDAIAAHIAASNGSDGDSYRAERDNYGRAIWLYLNKGRLFDDAENLFHANHYRHLGRMYEAFEVDASDGLDFQWNDAVKAAFERKLQQELDLTDDCKVDHILVTSSRDDGSAAGSTVTSHLLIVRHAGPLSSVPAMKDGRKRPLYYRPAVEATLLFSPHDCVVEVFAASPGVRPIIASAFAEVGLQHNLSDRPLTLRQYNLARFLGSLTLDVPALPGFDIESAALVEAEARPQNLKRRVSLRVAADDDIEAVAGELFGANNIFRRATVISKVVIAVRYSADGEGKTKTLNIALSDPNRCNLLSNRDPKQRELGFALLEYWGIMRRVRQLNAAEEGASFPSLLQLYDENCDEVSRRWLESRGIAIDPLLEGGFLVRRGRHTSIDIDLEHGQVQMVPVQPSTTAGHVRYQCPSSRHWVDIPSRMLEYYEVKRDWMKERVTTALRSSLNASGQGFAPDGLIFLGELDLDGVRTPIYLGRQLGNHRVIRECDMVLRACNDASVGIVLSASDTAPAFLGPNVVIQLAPMLVDGAMEPAVDLDRLKVAFAHGKVLARGGQTVDLIINPNRTATLHIPGKAPLPVLGDKQLKIVERLVKAYRAGNPAIAAKDLMEGTGVLSPSQAFRNWHTIAGTYIGRPEGKKRGAWQLIV